MIYLIVKMLVLLLLAAALGAALGWFLRGARDREANEARQRDDAARLADLRAARDVAEAKVASVAEAEAARAAAEAKAARLGADIAAAIKAQAAAEANAQAAEKALEEARAGDAVELASSNVVGPAPIATSEAFVGMERPADGGDDLKQISGVGPKLEGVLHDLGIWRFSQIAAFTPADVAWVDERLQFKGRIERDDWISQAKALASGS